MTHACPLSLYRKYRYFDDPVCISTDVPRLMCSNRRSWVVLSNVASTLRCSSLNVFKTWLWFWKVRHYFSSACMSSCIMSSCMSSCMSCCVRRVHDVVLCVVLYVVLCSSCAFVLYSSCYTCYMYGSLRSECVFTCTSRSAINGTAGQQGNSINDLTT